MTDLVRTRIAPSPTGNLHVGTARTALYSELLARHHGGQFIIRIEDTDTSRSTPAFEANILEGLAWLGLRWDEGPDIGGEFGLYRQSERTDSYTDAIEQLLAAGAAYTEEGTQAIKLAVTPQEVTFTDLVRGSVTVHTDTWGGDFVIARTKTSPVFHLAVVVDDAAMKISHVIRGEDHLVNTARHILLQQALGLPQPAYAHLPLLVDEQRRKLSKRTGDTDLLAYRAKGIVPAAMLNYLALLGWSPKDDHEVFSHEELIERFTLDGVQKSGALFSLTKLVSVNKHYVRQQTPSDLLNSARPFLTAAQFDLTDTAYWEQAVALEQERIGSVAELPTLINYLRPDWEASYAPTLLIWKKSDHTTTRELIDKTRAFLTDMTDDFTVQSVTLALMTWIDTEALGRGDVLWPMRVALSGRDKSPGPFEIAAVLGKDETLRRLGIASKKLQDTLHT